MARRGETRIVENALGLVMAAAGVDASNVPVGHVVLLPLDPDASARRLREALLEDHGVDVAVVVTDTAGRAWRTGQTDIAIGVAGLDPLEVLDGQVDPYGNALVVTAPAVADEVAGLAELAAGKLTAQPVVLVRGLGDRVLPAGDHGPGARVLQRPRDADLFALGAREAVLEALAAGSADCFGQPAAPEEVAEAADRVGLVLEPRDEGWAVTGPATVPGAVRRERARLLAHALAWRVSDAARGADPDTPVLSPPHP